LRNENESSANVYRFQELYAEPILLEDFVGDGTGAAAGGAQAAHAQGDARFSGTVLDQTGAFVPGATVTVKNQKTGESARQRQRRRDAMWCQT
jgi:hypothetical protein